MQKHRALALLLVALVALPADTAPRSRAVRAEFVRLNACPSTGEHRLPCPGFHIEHTTPLCIGGVDAVENLTWMSVEEHKVKTKSDRRLCRTTP